MDFPKVIICVPVRNGAKTIRRTLDSIFAQDYPNFEVVISDNCSDDETANIVHEYGRSDRLKYYYNSKLENWAEGNWNHILSLAKGSLIALYHADDLYMPTMVSRQVEFLKNHPKMSAVFTTTQTINESDQFIRNGIRHLPKDLEGQNEFDFPDLFNAVLKHSNFLTVPTLMARSNLLEKVGLFNLKYCTAADIDYWFRLALVGSVGIIDEPLHCYRISENQLSSKLFKLRTYRAHFLQVMDYYLSITEYRNIVTVDAYNYYKMHGIVDNVIRSMNLLFSGDLVNARKLIQSNLFSPEFRKGLKIKKFTRKFLMSIPVYIIIKLGMGRLLYFLYEKNYKPWRKYGTMKFIKNK